MITAYNKVLAVEPPENKGAERKVVDGVAQFTHRNSLTRLTVVFGNETIPSGSVVYVNTLAMTNQAWSTSVFEVDGKKIVLMPETNVLLVGKE